MSRTRLLVILAALLLARLGLRAADNASTPPERLTYHTDARHGRVIFLRNDEAQPTAAKVAQHKAAPTKATGPLFNRADLGKPEWTNAVATARDFLRRHAGEFLGVAASRQSAANSGGASVPASRGMAPGRLASTLAPPTASSFSPDTDLAPLRAERDVLGMTHVRFTQTYRGLPVFGADASVHLAADGRVSSAGARVVPDIHVDIQPTLTREGAVALAVAMWQAQFHRTETPEATSTNLCLLAPGLLKNDGNPATHPVWEVKLLLKCGDCGEDARPISAEDYYLDAQSGELREQLTESRSIDRKLVDCSQPSPPGSHTSCPRIVIDGYRYGRYDSFGDGPSGPNPLYLPGEVSVDVDTLWDKLNDVHQFYQTHFGRNGASNQGGTGNGYYNPIRTYGATYADYAPTWYCPNALMSQGSLQFCKGMIVDDVVAHEYAHAVEMWCFWDWVSGLAVGMTYQGESGALDESHADVMGEMFELAKTGSTDWIDGAGSPGHPRGLVDPPSFTNSTSQQPFPDRSHAATKYCGSGDYSGVHCNSTIPSKAAYLMSRGGFFNGCTISPLGEAKVEQIVYRAVTQYYAQTETFNGACAKWIQAATDLYGTGSDEVRQTTRALQAVELDQPGYCSGLPPHPPQALDVEGW